MNEVILQNVTKSYGNVQGVSGLNLKINPGITGILGPNGAGKSTTMKLILGLSRPSIGNVSVNGVNPFDNFELKKTIGFVAEYLTCGNCRWDPLKLAKRFFSQSV